MGDTEQYAERFAEQWRAIDPETRTAALNGGWYRESRRTARAMARRYGVSLKTTAGIIAALSPRTHWADNVRGAERVLYRRNLPDVLRELAPIVPGFGANVRKAERIAEGEDPLVVLGGDKVRAFYRAILGDPDAVVIDVWMIRAAGEDPKVYKATGRAYALMAEALRIAADEAGASPADFQAIVWTHVRGGAE